MGQMTDPALMGWAMGLFVLLVGAVARWLVQRAARQYEALETRVAELSARLIRAEYDIANDKAGRAAFAATQTQLVSLDQRVQHLVDTLRDFRATTRDDIQNIWSRVNRQGGSGSSAA